MWTVYNKFFNTCRKQRGFTLVETLVYMGLLSILMASALVTAWQLLESMQADGVRISTQEEGSFVLQKIDRILTSAQSISQPSSAHPSTTALIVHEGDFNPVTIRLNSASGTIEMRRSDALSFVSLTTPNVSVKDLSFYYIAPSRGMPAGMGLVFTIGKEVFEIEKYIQ